MSTITRTTTGPLSGPSTTSEIGSDENQIGGGVGSQNGEVPDPNSQGLTLGLAMILQSFLPEEVGTDFEARLAEVTDKLKKTTSDTETDRVKNEMETKRLNIEENEARIEEAETKMLEAEAKAKNGSIWDKIAIAFQMIGAALMAALGAVLIATGVGAVAGALMIAGAAMMLLSAINSIVQQSSKDGLGIAGSIAKATGADMDEAGKADMGFGITLAIATAITAIAATVLTAGAAGPALVGAVQSMLSLASSVTSTGGAIAGAVSAGYRMDATFDRAEATEKQAETKEVEAFMQQLDDMIDQALAMLMSANDKFNAMMDSMTEMIQESGNTLSNTRFAG